MARVFGLLLIVLAVWYAVTVFNGEAPPWGESATEASGPRAGTTQASAPSPPDGQAAPGGVTSRVRARVNAAVEDRYRQQSGE